MPHNFGDLQKVHFWRLPKVGWMTKQRSQQPDRTRQYGQYWPRDPVHGFTFAVWDIQQALRILRSPIPRLEECPPGLDTCVLQRKCDSFKADMEPQLIEASHSWGPDHAFSQGPCLAQARYWSARSMHHSVALTFHSSETWLKGRDSIAQFATKCVWRGTNWAMCSTVWNWWQKCSSTLSPGWNIMKLQLQFWDMISWFGFKKTISWLCPNHDNHIMVSIPAPPLVAAPVRVSVAESRRETRPCKLLGSRWFLRPRGARCQDGCQRIQSLSQSRYLNYDKV